MLSAAEHHSSGNMLRAEFDSEEVPMSPVHRPGAWWRHVSMHAVAVVATCASMCRDSGTLGRHLVRRHHLSEHLELEGAPVHELLAHTQGGA